MDGLTKEERKAQKLAAKQAERDAKAQAKADKSAAKAQAKQDKAAAKAAKKGEPTPAATPAAPADAPAGSRAERKAAKKAAKQAERESHLARYKQLRANVRRRRILYVFVILLAIGVLAGSVWDILYNDSDFMWYVFAAYAVLFILGLLMLLSRRRHLEEVEEMRDLERVFLEDPVSGEIFQISATKLPELVGVEFSSPTSGEFYRMPSLDAQQVERVLPNGSLQTTRAAHNGVDIEVATFGKKPLDVTFR